MHHPFVSIFDGVASQATSRVPAWLVIPDDVACVICCAYLLFPAIFACVRLRLHMYSSAMAAAAAFALSSVHCDGVKYILHN